MKGTNTVKVQDLLSLASQYRAAAFKLEGAPPDPTQLPQRLLALHAIELYLDALLRAKGIEEQPIGTFRHDLGERAGWSSRPIGDRKTFVTARVNPVADIALGAVNITFQSSDSQRLEQVDQRVKEEVNSPDWRAGSRVRQS
jgi:hypothetical protein